MLLLIEGYNPHTWEVEARGPRVQCQPGPHDILSKKFFFQKAKSISKKITEKSRKCKSKSYTPERLIWGKCFNADWKDEHLDKCGFLSTRQGSESKPYLLPYCTSALQEELSRRSCTTNKPGWTESDPSAYSPSSPQAGNPPSIHKPIGLRSKGGPLERTRGTWWAWDCPAPSPTEGCLSLLFHSRVVKEPKYKHL